jgi:hypothetical protein
MIGHEVKKGFEASTDEPFESLGTEQPATSVHRECRDPFSRDVV